MRLNIRTSVDHEEEEICIDCGSGHNVVDRNFLKKFDHTISSTDKPLNLKGYGGRVKRHSEWAEWFKEVNPMVHLFSLRSRRGQPKPFSNVQCFDHSFTKIFKIAL